jgi:hypothetical protein
MSLTEKVQQLNREIGATVERAMSDLRREVSDRLRSSSEAVLQKIEELAPELPGSFLRHEDLAPAPEELEELSASARRSALGELRDALAALDRARSQSEILTALLTEAGRYASRAALLLARGGEIRGWAGRGFGSADAALSNVALDASNGSWGRLAQGQGALRLSAADCAELCSRLDVPLPREGVLVPLVLRDRVAAGLYADRVGDGALAVEALQILTYAASQAIESLPFRERASTPTLTLEDEAPAGAAAVETAPPDETAAPAPTEEPREESAPAAPAAPAAINAEPAPAEAGADQVGATQALESAPEAWAAPEETPDETEVEVEAEPEPAPAAWTAEPEPAADEVEPVAEPSPSGGWAAPAPARTEQLPVMSEAAPAGLAGGMETEVPRYPRSVDAEPAATAPFSGTSPEATVLLPRPNLQTAAPAPEPPPLRPVAPPADVEPQTSSFDGLRAAPPLGAAGTPEVRPPSGVDGPGWAFATTRVPVSPSDETLHEEARRLARLLVSEIKLYNEEQVEEGRRNRDIYERLKEDIDRSRQMYEERVDPRILRSTDYFYQELVRILASGDSRALGI